MTAGETIKNGIGRVYAGLFAHKVTQPVNDALMNLALRGMGHNNGWQLRRSGEAWFIGSVLAPTKPKVCVDVGANIGEYSRALLRRTNAYVYAFEPLPDAFDELTRMDTRYVTRLNPVNAALGAEVGSMPLHYGNGLSEHASLSEDVNRIDWVGMVNTHTMDVPVTTLDEYFDTKHFNRIDLIKIDTEGYEYEVLLGGEATIKAFRPRFIQIEMNVHQLARGHTLLDFADLLPDYDAFRLLPHGMLRVDPLRPQNNIACFANYVFVRKES